MAPSHITSWHIRGKGGNKWQISSSWGRRGNLDSVLKSRDITLLTKVHYTQGYGLPSGHIWLWELDHKEGRMPKNWCLQTPEGSLNIKQIKPINLKRSQCWILIGRTNAKAEALVFWSSDASRWLIGKVPDAGKDRG